MSDFVPTHLLLRRRKDGVEVVTLSMPPQRQPYTSRRKSETFQPVRYVKTGRKGYLKVTTLEDDFVVVGGLSYEDRWGPPSLASTNSESAAALQEMRDRDIAKVRSRILDNIQHPEPGSYRTLGDLKPSANALAQLDQALHMILAGV